MSGHIRHIHRNDWLSLRKKTYARKRIDFLGVETEAQLMHIGYVLRPVTVPGKDGRVTIADAGYRWLQLAPKGGHWWMTAMYTPEGRSVQYYFDVTDGNVLTGGADAWFEDMYLDAVLHTDGTAVLLDADELDEALAAGDITAAQHETAVRTGKELMGMLGSDFAARADEIYEELARLPAQKWAALAIK